MMTFVEFYSNCSDFGPTCLNKTMRKGEKGEGRNRGKRKRRVMA